MREKNRKCVAFGNAVRKLRLDRGVSQEALADEIHIHRTYIGGIERGERNPTLTTICGLAAALNIHPEDLLYEARLVEDAQN